MEVPWTRSWWALITFYLAKVFPPSLTSFMMVTHFTIILVSTDFSFEILLFHSFFYCYLIISVAVSWILFGLIWFGKD